MRRRITLTLATLVALTSFSQEPVEDMVVTPSYWSIGVDATPGIFRYKTAGVSWQNEYFTKLGISGAYSVNNYVKVRVGFQYYAKSVSASYSITEIQCSKSPCPETQHVEKDLQYYDIPVTVKLRFYDQPKTAYFVAGTVVSYRNHYYRISELYSGYTEVNTISRSFTFDRIYLHLGLGYEMELSKHFSINGEGVFHRDIFAGDVLYFLGVSGGVNYHF